jgi:hypothetical protein
VIYLLSVSVLVTAVMFLLPGLCILALFAWTEAEEYAQALRVMRRIAPTSREPFVISRLNSRNHNSDSIGGA